jgi:hydrogenase maturation factor
VTEPYDNDDEFRFAATAWSVEGVAMVSEDGVTNVVNLVFITDKDPICITLGDNVALHVGIDLIRSSRSEPDYDLFVPDGF